MQRFAPVGWRGAFQERAKEGANRRNFTPGIPETPPLMLAWELRRLAEKEDS